MSLVCRNIFAFLFSVHYINYAHLSRCKRVCFQKYLAKHSFVKHTCSWHDKPVVLKWILHTTNGQRELKYNGQIGSNKVAFCLGHEYLLFELCLLALNVILVFLRNVLNVFNMFFLKCHNHVEVNVYKKWCGAWHFIPF